MTYLYKKKISYFLFFICLLIDLPLLYAKGLILDRTRIILPYDAGSITVQLYNSNEHPIITQLWIDKGVPLSDLENAPMPILVYPPIIKLNSGEKRYVALTLINKKQFSQQQETLYWLNSKEIAPSQNNVEEINYLLNIALVSRNKIFIRPKPLMPGGSDVWIKSLTCRLNRKTKPISLHCANPSPYYATISTLQINNDLEIEGEMLAPFGEHQFSLPTIVKQKHLHILVNVINDQGFKQTITVN